jgi:hypothetical protein
MIIENQKPPLEGKYFPLESDNIKIFLPKEFKKLSKDEYLSIIEQGKDSINLLSERERLHRIKKSGWDIYFFEYLESSSILSVIPIEYVKFNRNDAQMLLNQIKYDMDQSTESTGNKFTKVEARFFETKEAQIFKAIYNVENKKYNLNFFREIYFVSFNKKSLYLLVREMTGHKTHYITKVVAKMTETQVKLYDQFLDDGDIMDNEKDPFWAKTIKR